MFQTVIWPDPWIGEFRSPFLRGDKERPLRLSLHVQSLRNLSGEDSAGYAAIRELGQLDLIDVLATGEDTFPCWRFLPTIDTDGYLHIEVLRDGTVSSLHCGIHLEQKDRGHHRFDDLADNDIFAARAHIALHRDIFVTASPLLLGCREKFTSANIHSPIEASRLAGLFLRSRDNWTYQRVGNATSFTSRHTFYWVLARTRLPALWRYFSACVHASEFLGKEILYLGQSVLERSSRALQARDAIGVQFYFSQNHGTGDVIMYHFDYLTLLLTGIFDAQAKIATVVYGIGGDKRHVSFRNEGFLKALQKHCISELYEVVTNDKCEQLMVMLHTLRNTIHHAGLTTTRARTAGRERSLIEVPDALQEDLWQAAVALGEPDEWGVTREEYRLLDVPTGQTSQKVRVSIEPYSYATRLVSEWFSLINQVANATEVEKLFSGKTMPELSREPPTDWHEYPRFSVLG